MGYNDKQHIGKLTKHFFKKKWVVISAIILLVVVVTAGAYFTYDTFFTGDKKPVKTKTNAVNDDESIDVVAIKKRLDENPVSADAPADEKSVYYNSQISANCLLDDNACTKFYEEALVKGLSVSSRSALSAATMYAESGNAPAARSALDYARKVISSQTWGSDPDGGIAEQLRDVDTFQKELGL